MSQFAKVWWQEWNLAPSISGCFCSEFLHDNSLWNGTGPSLCQPTAGPQRSLCYCHCQMSLSNPASLSCFELKSGPHEWRSSRLNKFLIWIFLMLSSSISTRIWATSLSSLLCSVNGLALVNKAKEMIWSQKLHGLCFWYLSVKLVTAWLTITYWFSTTPKVGINHKGYLSMLPLSSISILTAFFLRNALYGVQTFLCLTSGSDT